jgi:hypothetical protein
MQAVLDAPVLAGVVVELGRAGQFGGHAGNAVDELFVGALAVQAAGVAA